MIRRTFFRTIIGAAAMLVGLKPKRNENSNTWVLTYSNKPRWDVLPRAAKILEDGFKSS